MLGKQLSKSEENRLANIEEECIRREIKTSVMDAIKNGAVTDENIQVFLKKARKQPCAYFVDKSWAYRCIKGRVEEIFILGVLIWNSKQGMLF